MHALVGGVALVLAIVFGILVASIYVALLLGGRKLPPAPCEMLRRSGAVGPAAARAKRWKDPAGTGNTRPR